jgi:hypothetical protein
MEFVLKAFSRASLDRAAARTALAFLDEYADGRLRPEECGVYEPFEPYQAGSFEEYVDWLVNPGGEFCFRRPSLQGCISNLCVPTGAAVPQPTFRTRWSLRIEAFDESEFLQRLLSDACRAARADYGFVATDADYRAKHFSSVPEGVSEVQQYIGENPEHGIPGLYWLTFFGPIYVDHFGADALASIPEAVVLDAGAVCLRFGEPAEETSDRRQAVIRILGERAFFDRDRPDRELVVPSTVG